jgi:hypothetical protein
MTTGAISDARVLQVIRDEGPLYFSELGERLGFPKPMADQVKHILEVTRPSSFNQYLDPIRSQYKGASEDILIIHRVYSSVIRLKDAEIVLYSDQTKKIGITNRWLNIQHTLGISLTDLSERTNKSLMVSPYFTENPVLTHTDVFILMPFTERLYPIYSDHISKAVKELGLTVSRADDIFSATPVMNDVWSSIYRSKLIIAECTGKNPNVFYEIGIAHTVGKPVILIAQSPEDVPFDLRYIRYIRYEYTPPGMTKFEESLKRTIRSTLNITSA